ncbi:MAG: MBL fold metallo-hydrolase [Gammaproteobacteria bacterium]|nr:MBL fold metallo-hydrolase [Gammaproteobacteria bacterium]
MIPATSFCRLERSPGQLLDAVLARAGRVLVFGRPGVGKSHLAAELAGALAQTGRRVSCVGADPGSPAFGVPGAVSLGEWCDGDWRLAGIEALCTLDAARFRLPLIECVRRLAARAPSGVLIVDAPGVVRGVAGAELLAGLVGAAAIDTVLVLTREQQAAPYAAELAALPAAVFEIPAAAQAHALGKGALARRRTRLWDAYLDEAQSRAVELAGLRLLGTPPPPDVPEAWPGRQLALLDDALGTTALGEAIGIEGDRLWLRMPGGGDAPSRLLLRDARRDASGRLVTARREHAATVRYAPPPDVAPAGGAGDGPRPVARVGPAVATLVNGIFGDPLLHVRLRHRKRSLLFDLGEAGRLPARIAHQVSDVFISHAHFDHIAGFLWLLRSRIADLPVCRLFGPPGLGEHVGGMVRGICWDRIGDRGPRFEVAELHDGRVQRGRRGSTIGRRRTACWSTSPSSASTPPRSITARPCSPSRSRPSAS